MGRYDTERVIICCFGSVRDTDWGIAVAQALQAELESMGPMDDSLRTAFTLVPTCEELLLLLTSGTGSTAPRARGYDFGFVIGVPNRVGLNVSSSRGEQTPHVVISRSTDGEPGSVRRLGRMISHVQADDKDPGEVAGEAIDAVCRFLASTAAAG